MNFVVSHPTGNTFVKALVEELHKDGLLSYFTTTIGFGNRCSAIFSKIKSKRNYNIPDAKIRRSWYPEIKRLLLKSNQEANRRAADLSFKSLDEKTASELSADSVKVVHGYEDGTSQTFRKAKDLGIQCSYELPIAHWATTRRLLAEEAERYPFWEPTLESTRESEEKLIRKDEELELADRIFCPSQFVFDSIPTEIKQNKSCQINPFGSPTQNVTSYQNSLRKNKKLKLLFVGSMSQRKGLADLFAAMNLMRKEPIELSIIGQPSMAMEFYRGHYADFTYYPPCTNAKVREIMQQHDALILPSIVEGRALVQQEALSCGIPIIVTPNSGGEDLVETGKTGYVVPIRAPEKIAEAIDNLINNKIDRYETRKMCQEKAKRYSWSTYTKKIIDCSLTDNSNIVQT
jgi:glycosyltransferase involved in cell wall biosynthesis